MYPEATLPLPFSPPLLLFADTTCERSGYSRKKIRARKIQMSVVTRTTLIANIIMKTISPKVVTVVSLLSQDVLRYGPEKPEANLRPGTKAQSFE